MFAGGSKAGFVFGLVLSVLGSLGPASAAEPLPARDVWYVYVAGDQRYGSEHVTVRRQEDGNLCYQVETRMLLDFLGQRQEITEKGKYVVTPKYVPVSLEFETASLAGPAQVRGRVQGGRLVVESQRGAQRKTTAIELTGDTTFRACLDDWLSSQPAGTAKAACRVISESSLGVDSVAATRAQTSQTGAVWNVGLGPERGQGQMIFDAEGIRRESVFRAPRLHLRRATAEEARTIRHRALEGREILMFPIDKPIAAPDHLTLLTVRLTWKDIPFERFQLEDERQQVVRRSQEKERYETVLRIRPVAPATGDSGYPVTGDQHRAYLAETRFIKPLDADIVRQARAWIGTEKTASGAVRALSGAVFRHMQGGSLIAETLPGPEVLQSKQGKCSEYSILFASLARSVGIPTRIALGMRLLNGCWVGHMWNEAYVGRWITVDTTTDEVGSVPALLKLVHSDSVMGTQPLRWEVTESLHVYIEEFEPRAPAAAGAFKTGIQDQVYTNAEFACRLTAPVKSWSLKDATRSGLNVPTIRFRIPNRDDINIHFVALSVPPIFTPASLIELRAARFKTMYKDYEVLKNAEYPVQRMTGRIFVFRRAGMKKETGTMKTTEVLWSDGTASFLLNLIAEEKSHDEYAAAFFKLLNSFEKLPMTPAKAAAAPSPAKGP